MKVYEVLVNGVFVGLVEVEPSKARAMENTAEGIVLQAV